MHIRRLHDEVCSPLSRIRQAVRLCTKPDSRSFVEKSRQFNYIGGLSICSRFWHCACSKDVRPNKATEEQDQPHLSENTMRSERVMAQRPTFQIVFYLPSLLREQRANYTGQIVAYKRRSTMCWRASLTETP